MWVKKMLYGMDDYDEFNTHKKLNLKKVILVSIIIVLILFLLIYSIVVKIFNKRVNNINNNQFYAVEEKNNEIEVEITENENNEIKQQLINNEENNKDDSPKKNIETYSGEHLQIPEHDLSKLETKFVPVFNENAPQLIKDIYYSDEKQVYLTFDDGPSKDITPQILDILEENDVKATFFVLGARVELYPDTVFEEYKMTEDIIKNALNNQDFNTYLFRFPGGSSGGRYESIKAEARELFRSYGIAFTNWNCLTGDAENKTTKEACIEEMLRTKGNQNSIILLMHDANDKQQTVDALPEIIQYYRNEGYTFKTFYDIFK